MNKEQEIIMNEICQLLVEKKVCNRICNMCKGGVDKIRKRCIL